MRAESSVKVPLIDRSFGPIALWENKKQLVDPEIVPTNGNWLGGGATKASRWANLEY